MIVGAGDRSGHLVSPLHYTLIIWASLYGYFLFGQFPDAWTWAGSLVIIASGLACSHRERRKSPVRCLKATVKSVQAGPDSQLTCMKCLAHSIASAWQAMDD